MSETPKSITVPAGEGKLVTVAAPAPLAVVETKPLAAGLMVYETITELLEIDNDSPREDVLKAIAVKDRLVARVKELGQQFDAALLEWLLKYKELEEGDMRWYVGHSRRTSCLNPSATLNTLFEKCGGSFERVCEYLAASPFKYGSVKDLLDSPELYAEHFESVPITDIRTGKVRRKVKKADKRFTK